MADFLLLDNVNNDILLLDSSSGDRFLLDDEPPDETRPRARTFSWRQSST